MTMQTFLAPKAHRHMTMVTRSLATVGYSLAKILIQSQTLGFWFDYKLTEKEFDMVNPVFVALFSSASVLQ